MCRGCVFVLVGDHSDLSRLQIWQCILGWAILESMLDVPNQELMYLIQNVRMSTSPPLHGTIFIYFCTLFLMCHYWVTYNMYVHIRPFPMIWPSSLAVSSQQGSGSRRTRNRRQHSHSTYPGDGSSSYFSLTLQKVNAFHLLLLNLWCFSYFLFYTRGLVHGFVHRWGLAGTAPDQGKGRMMGTRPAGERDHGQLASQPHPLAKLPVELPNELPAEGDIFILAFYYKK